MLELNINPFEVAQYYIDKCDANAGDSITHLKIQKLLYYTQAWGLVLLKKSFFGEKFQAWAHGPVLPTIFHDLKKYGYKNLVDVNIIQDNKSNLNSETKDIIEEVWNIYGELSAKHLESLTHQELPWLEARQGLSPEAKSEKIIDQNTMYSYYKKFQSGK